MDFARPLWVGHYGLCFTGQIAEANITIMGNNMHNQLIICKLLNGCTGFPSYWPEDSCTDPNQMQILVYRGRTLLSMLRDNSYWIEKRGQLGEMHRRCRNKQTMNWKRSEQKQRKRGEQKSCRQKRRKGRMKSSSRLPRLRLRKNKLR